jgi:hypothetical protein
MIAPPINISSSSLSQTPQRIVFAQPADTIWYPPAIVVNGELVQQNPAIILGVQVNSVQAPVLPFGLQGDNIDIFRQRGITEIWVSLLSAGSAGDVAEISTSGTALGASSGVVLMAGSAIGIGYSKALNSAGQVSSGPSFGLS